MTGKSEKQIRYAMDSIKAFGSIADQEIAMCAPRRRDTEESAAWKAAAIGIWNHAREMLETIEDAGEALDIINPTFNGLAVACQRIARDIKNGKSIEESLADRAYGPEASCYKQYAAIYPEYVNA